MVSGIFKEKWGLEAKREGPGPEGVGRGFWDYFRAFLYFM